MSMADRRTKYTLCHVPDGEFEGVRQAVEMVRQYDPPLVHGDVRWPNMLEDLDSGGECSGCAKIVDFDLAGEVNETRYPFHLLTRIIPDAAE